MRTEPKSKKVTFTPGPWSLNGSQVVAKNMQRVAYGKNEEFTRDYIVCQPNLYTDPGRATTEANARLISAAPDLLESLIDCLECEFAVTEKAAIAKARAAIAKALGSAA